MSPKDQATRALSSAYRNQFAPSTKGGMAITHRGDLVIWANDVEVAIVKHLFEHVVDSLLGGPRCVRLVFTSLLASKRGPHPSGTASQSTITMVKTWKEPTQRGGQSNLTGCSSAHGILSVSS